MDQTKHKEIRYLKRTEQITDKLNDPLSKNMTELDENIFEIEKAKRKITLNQPVQLHDQNYEENIKKKEPIFHVNRVKKFCLKIKSICFETM